MALVQEAKDGTSGEEGACFPRRQLVNWKLPKPIRKFSDSNHIPLCLAIDSNKIISGQLVVIFACKPQKCSSDPWKLCSAD